MGYSSRLGKGFDILQTFLLRVVGIVMHQILPQPTEREKNRSIFPTTADHHENHQFPKICPWAFFDHMDILSKLLSNFQEFSPATGCPKCQGSGRVRKCS